MMQSNEQGLPNGWELTTIEEISNYIQRGKSPKYVSRSQYPVINQKSIRWTGIEEQHLKYIREDTISTWGDERMVQAGDILWNSTGTGTIGRACLASDADTQIPIYVDSHVTIVRPCKDYIDPRYVFNWIKSPSVQLKIDELSTGTTNQTELSKSTVSETHIPIAPLNEQHRIADNLDTTLAAVEACKQKLNNVSETIKRFRQSVLAAAVSGELTREWREERGNEEEWEMTTLANLVQRIDAGLNLKCDERIPQHEERGLIKISAVTWGEFNEDESKTLPASAEVKEKNKIKPGDLLISRANTIELVGSCVIVKGITKNLYLPDKVLRLEADESLKKWVLINLRSPGGRSQIESLSSGNQLSMRNLSQKNMLSIKLPVPTPEELDEIYRKSDALFDQADTIEEQIQTALSAASRLMPSLLAIAFRGELVPQDPNDEPASVLLERIKNQRELESSTKKPAKRGRKEKADAAQLAIPEAIADNHLAKVLEECGALSELALIAASELQPEVFQLQIAKELNAGGLKQVDVAGEAAYADAAWEEEL